MDTVRLVNFSEFHQLVCDLHRAETETHRNPDPAEAVRYKRRALELINELDDAYEATLDELQRLQRLTTWRQHAADSLLRPNRGHDVAGVPKDSLRSAFRQVLVVVRDSTGL